MKFNKYYVEGKNFQVCLILDEELHQKPYMEAATEALEYVFKDDEYFNPNVLFVAPINGADENCHPEIGLGLTVYTEEDKDNKSRHEIVSSSIAAKNGGLLWIVDSLRELV